MYYGYDYKNIINGNLIKDIIPLGEREPNRSFLNLNRIKDGIMRKDTKTAKITKIEVERNKQISKKRYIAAPCGIRMQRSQMLTE